MTKRVPLVVSTAPERIWLQIADDSYSATEAFPDDHSEITWCQDSCVATEVKYVRADLHASIAERCERLEAALRVYNAAKSMSRYGDYSGFEFPKREMRRPGESAWGWICEKHGLSYGGGCICCEDDYKVFCTRKDSEARNARNDALNAAFNAAEILLRERTP